MSDRRWLLIVLSGGAFHLTYLPAGRRRERLVVSGPRGWAWPSIAWAGYWSAALPRGRTLLLVNWPPSSMARPRRSRAFARLAFPARQHRPGLVGLPSLGHGLQAARRSTLGHAVSHHRARNRAGTAGLRAGPRLRGCCRTGADLPYRTGLGHVRRGASGSAGPSAV